MTPASSPAVELRDIVALRLLSAALRAPSAESLAEVALLADAILDGPSRDVVEGIRSELGAGVEFIARASERLFGGAVAVPPYEGSFESDPFRQARQLADVAAFYRALDADASGPGSERPDHAGTELEFLSFLLLRGEEALADGRPADAEACATVAGAFLDDHAGRWLPTFFRALASAPDRYYRSIGRLGEAVIADLLEVFGVTPEPVTTRAPRTAVERDELMCAAGDEPVIVGLA
jgi:TorA maturation chaperone TorD